MDGEGDVLRILVATDGSPHALRAGRAAAALAQAVQSAEVTVLTVAHAPLGTVVGLGAVTASGMAADYGGAAEAIFEEARATLDRTVEIFTAAGLAVTARLARGDPAAEIIRTATESGTDFIVMGTRGLGVVGKLVLGSVTEHVLHAAPCPVVIVR